MKKNRSITTLTKGKSITLLTIICVVLAALLVMTFARFPVGIYDYNSVLGAISLDYDLAGGSAYTLTLADDNEEEVENVNEVMDTLSSRLNALGYKDNFSITALKSVKEGVEDYDIRIIAKSGINLSTDISAAAAYGTVKFYGGTSSDPSTEIMNQKNAVANASYVGMGTDESGQTIYQTSLEFTDYGYKALSDAITSATTGDNASSSYYLKITLGDSTLLNSQISSEMTNKTVYITSSTEAAARQMAMQIKTGGLEYKYEVSNGQAVSAILGEKTPLYTVLAVAAVIVLALVLIAVLYRGYGVVATLSMLVFIVLELGMLIAVPGITLSFGGVFGIILASVFALDGLIILARRFKEEYASGKTIKAAYKAGYKRAFKPILGANLIVGVIGLLLFIFASGALQNFGITLGIGIVVSFITTSLISAMFTYIILPLVKNGEKFFNLKREV